jgi:pimeloyl-ACP methyl ester carboxylesterase/class 3 adenylate cyclase
VELPETRYAKSGGVSIAYQVVGDGPIDLVFIPGFVSNVEYYWEMPAAARAFRRFASFSRLIIWDKRGTGLSDPVARVPTLDERAEDLRAVMDAAGSERAALMGISEGGPMGLLFSAAYPERTTALILHGVSPKFSASADWPWGWSPQEITKRLDELERNWGKSALLDLFAPTLANDPTAAQAWGRMQRAGASPAMGRAVYEALCQLDCRQILPAIRVPTLILHRTGERVAYVEGARYMAEQIPGAKLVEFPGADHSFTVGAADPVIDEIEEFLTGVRPGRVPDRVLATVLFTDIVGSTERAAQLGDQRWRDLLAAHDAAVRRELAAFDGKEVNWTGDGFLATFAGPSRAIECACAVRDAMRHLGLEIRAGLHTGECELLARDQLGGLAVHIGARVAAMAGAGEVLLSSTVKDLVAGSGTDFVEKGSHTLKGVPGEWRLFAVKT